MTTIKRKNIKILKHIFLLEHGLIMGAGSSSGGKKGELLETMADHDESINCMVLSEDGSMLVTGSEDSTARYRYSTARQPGIDIVQPGIDKVQPGLDIVEPVIHKYIYIYRYIDK